MTGDPAVRLGHLPVARSGPRRCARAGRGRLGAAHHRSRHHHRIARAQLRLGRASVAARRGFGTSGDRRHRREEPRPIRAVAVAAALGWPSSSAASPKGTRASSASTSSSPNRDRLSPAEIARELPGLPPAVADALAQLPSSDRDLAEAMAAVPTVLALAPSHEEAAPDSDPLRPAPIRQAGDDPRPFLKSYKSLVQSQPDLRAAAHGPPGKSVSSRIPTASSGGSLSL